MILIDNVIPLSIAIFAILSAIFIFLGFPYVPQYRKWLRVMQVPVILYLAFSYGRVGLGVECDHYLFTHSVRLALVLLFSLMAANIALQYWRGKR